MGFGRALTCLVIFLLVCVPFPRLSRAEILGAELRVNGLACPFCAFGIEKKLRNLQGVEEVEVLLDDGKVRVAFAENNRATVEALREAVSASGFQLAGMLLDVRGGVVVDGDEALLDGGKGVRFRLLALQGGHARPISRADLERLWPDASEGSMQVSGTVEARGDGLPALVIAAPGAPTPEAK